NNACLGSRISRLFGGDLQLLQSKVSIAARADKKRERFDHSRQRSREEIERAEADVDIVIILVEFVDLFGITMRTKTCSQRAEIRFLLRYLESCIATVRGRQVSQQLHFRILPCFERAFGLLNGQLLGLVVLVFDGL